jgi:carboxypeptidase C (cathepsin A)
MGIPALVYAGDVDFICNYLGNKAWTLKLEWEGEESFNGAEEHSWKIRDLPVRPRIDFFCRCTTLGTWFADQPRLP